MEALVPFTTSGQLLNCVDKKMLVALRDGRKIFGVLRSYDQFANLVLNDAVERIHAEDEYADIPRGLYLIRGENVVLMGEVDLDFEDVVPLKSAPIEDVLNKTAVLDENRAVADSVRDAVLRQRGFCTERVDGDVDVHNYGHEPSTSAFTRQQQVQHAEQLKRDAELEAEAEAALQMEQQRAYIMQQQQHQQQQQQQASELKAIEEQQMLMAQQQQMAFTQQQQHLAQQHAQQPQHAQSVQPVQSMQTPQTPILTPEQHQRFIHHQQQQFYQQQQQQHNQFRY
ncbi:U6 snRNA-associated Sm-like protein LSm1 [Wallemia ichthyophaga EXF-994]|uniref:U6 snRNA-associated Sm-like protein LSm1 n=1 Tax=Wallemia ichthyophaga (strain EXF-994 / CBS 113033) TaxID=1299270 RepID=R9A9L2_WALI9|nr:U6 snRNA-associated Sm-like protein LSm1 [Wallemia ichthyophaga EXF-994]EOQ98866.1 U6 snRNA-associated Sm-like protein LSm1 [Wallemia ichthyophaga EXF-994]